MNSKIESNLVGNAQFKYARLEPLNRNSRSGDLEPVKNLPCPERAIHASPGQRPGKNRKNHQAL